MLEYLNINELGSNKKVFIFYHIWHSAFMINTVKSDTSAPRNITKILQDNEDAINNQDVWGPEVSYHYWGEPLFGFYDITIDEYVIRKHASMLNDAGVDGIVIDYTNYMGNGSPSYTKDALTNLLNVFNKIRQEGGSTPTVSLMLTWAGKESGKALSDFYHDFYLDHQYDNLWFRWEGKPLVLANTECVSDEIKNYFTLRRPHPFYTPPTEENAWPWLSIYPQEPGFTKENKKEVVSVGVAQNWSESLDFMSAQDEHGKFICRGRSYSSKAQKLLSDPISSEYQSQNGVNFKECFERAIELDPDIIFVTGWNEWIAARFLKIPTWARCSKDKVSPLGGFCDCFTTEFSRDIEPTRDGNLNDSFYLILTDYVRKFKGVKVKEIVNEHNNIFIDGNFDDWAFVKNEYFDDINDIAIRDVKGIGNKRYINDTGRNDFKTLKITYDREYIYFYAETVNDISEFTDSYWMNLYIGISSKLPNWEGYNFVVNRTNVTSRFTCLEKSTGGYNWETVSEKVPYCVNGNKLELAIKREYLGLYNQEIDIAFKWCDNIQFKKDYLEFYTNGDCAPNGRFNYVFKANDK